MQVRWPCVTPNSFQSILADARLWSDYRRSRYTSFLRPVLPHLHHHHHDHRDHHHHYLPRTTPPRASDYFSLFRYMLSVATVPCARDRNATALERIERKGRTTKPVTGEYTCVSVAVAAFVSLVDALSKTSVSGIFGGFTFAPTCYRRLQGDMYPCLSHHHGLRRSPNGERQDKGVCSCTCGPES